MPEAERFEADIAAYVGSVEAVACASGSDALLLALMADDLQPVDEVITTPFTFIATAGVPAHLRVRPVFVDIDSDTTTSKRSRLKQPFRLGHAPLFRFTCSAGLPADMKALMDRAAAARSQVLFAGIK